MQAFDIRTHDGARVVFGVGAEARVAALLADEGASRVLIVALPHHRAGADRVARQLDACAVGVFAGATPQVPLAVARAGAEVARSQQADWVLAHGGGSAIGLAKAIALQVDVAVAAIPTTYAGSERTNIWGRTADGVKTTGRDPRVLPRLVVYDPTLTAPLPARVAQTSLLNALAHSVETLYSAERTPEALDAARDSVDPLVRGLAGVSRAPGALGPSAEALYGAYLAATALGGAQIALHHKLAHVLGGSFGTPHALTHSVLLPYTMAYNLAAAPDARAALRPALGDDPAGALYDLMRDLGLPTNLAALQGPRESDLGRVVFLALQKQYANPREVTAAGLCALLQDMWHDRRPSVHTPPIHDPRS